MRWLHNQSLHQPGIGSGFAVIGNKGDREVIIEPGYAIDADGREIVLSETVILPIPPVAGDDFGGPVFFDLTVSYPNERDLEQSETRAGVCAARGTIRLRETPVFCWVRLGSPPELVATDSALETGVTKGLRLRLARAQILNCQLDRPLSLAQRRNAKPPEQPYVACGSTEGDLVWSIEQTRSLGVRLTATVDTTPAGFRTTPSYSAHLLGGREFTFTNGSTTLKRVLDGFVLLIVPPQIKSHFAFSLLVPDSLLTKVENPADPHPGDLPGFVDQLRKGIEANQWRIDWIGVEG
jgi:hypothetical protein